MSEQNATFKEWLVHGSEPWSIPGYDLFALIFGVLSVTLVFRIEWSAGAISVWEIAGLIAFVCLAGVFSYKAHTARNPDC
ncbi:hypothetical membrane protein [Pseudomonas veronii 1YdBTEX2]|uniref:Hypothetical membrane protein n=1 Tax=Pseudomonas veronii 1YdBTEX2 TaxID=1295141 RepID=A0A1D3K8S8_PSEVE|nr:hypothetical protein [Pseudomonas sp. AP19]OEC64324.1 hypothetical protein A7D21_33530 [Pseudomonas sp. AP19]SBW84591.1 hypothetical membrane protein [Pseudomonas veronii 1YdBTEX2]